MNVFIPFVNDDINEPLFEGFYVHVSIDTVRSDPRDTVDAEIIRNGVALVHIEDDDSMFKKTLSCRLRCIDQSKTQINYGVITGFAVYHK